MLVGEWRTGASGPRKRVHRMYVDVLVRLGRDGTLDPVAILWPDGRRFVVDEVLERGVFGAEVQGRGQARWRVRFGGHETELWLERRRPQTPREGVPSLRWWVYAYDDAADGASGPEGRARGTEGR